MNVNPGSTAPPAPTPPPPASNGSNLVRVVDQVAIERRQPNPQTSPSPGQQGANFDTLYGELRGSPTPPSTANVMATPQPTTIPAATSQPVQQQPSATTQPVVLPTPTPTPLPSTQQQQAQQQLPQQANARLASNGTAAGAGGSLPPPATASPGVLDAAFAAIFGPSPAPAPVAGSATNTSQGRRLAAAPCNKSASKGSLSRKDLH